MQELLNNAWSGWLRYTDNGKFAALLLAVLLFLWFRKECKNKELLLYATIFTVLCICPVSAALLQKYQTRFYDYEWIWNLVPVTIMVAYGITVFLGELWERYGKEVLQKGSTVTRKTFWETVAITAGTLAVVLLCGKLGNPVFEAEDALQERQQAEAVLEALMERWVSGDMTEMQVLVSGEQTAAEVSGAEGARPGTTEPLVLWAPQEVMGYARAYDGNIRLIYGRNMWDKALMAYSYESYGDVVESLYQWMTSVEENPNQSREEFLEGGVPCVEAAIERGVNCILLSGETAKENVEALEAVLGQNAELVEGYYVFYSEL